MVNIIEKSSEYSNSWDYSFLIVAIIAIIIGTIITVFKMHKIKTQNTMTTKEVLNNEKVLDDPGSLLKKK